jgi:hypothetical protein
VGNSSSTVNFSSRNIYCATITGDPKSLPLGTHSIVQIGCLVVREESTRSTQGHLVCSLRDTWDMGQLRARYADPTGVWTDQKKEGTVREGDFPSASQGSMTKWMK